MTAEKPFGVKKECFKCHAILPANENYFYKHPRMTSGLIGKCKTCSKADISPKAKKTRCDLRISALNAYSGNDPKCAICGETTLEFLAIDHVDGGGSRDRKENGNLYLRLRRESYPAGFRVLCHNHNFSIGIYSRCK